jgi:photosystem II stability/assembly factor-like uncharacterized protein
MKHKYILEKLTTYLFYLSILFFLIAFNFQDSRTGGWYQQFMPNLNGKPLSDVFFIDSLVGWAVTNTNVSNDSAYILKTTNGGDNWNIIYYSKNNFNKIKFINYNTGFTAGVTAYIGASCINKTTNGGLNWFFVNPPDAFFTLNDISILNIDTIWVSANESLTGGLFRTTNGGVSWQTQYSQTSANPSHIYMFNARIGFIDANVLKKTTDGGSTWTSITSEGQFSDMHFVDSLTGWKCYGGVQKTTNGGLNWIAQPLPSGGNIITTGLSSFSNVNIDTIWGVGGWIYYPNKGNRGMIYRTTNGGNNWYFQVPDSSINIFRYQYCLFVNKIDGWVYLYSNGVHTVTGGDSSFIMSTIPISSNTPDNFKLEQNYPNPFNSMTNVKFQMLNSGFVELKVFNISGRFIKILAKQNFKTGEHTIKFDGFDLTSGVYFYSLFVDGVRMDTKKAVLIK